MENPAYWTSIHYAIMAAYQSETDFEKKVDKVLQTMTDAGYELTRDEIHAKLVEYQKNQEIGLCGLSLPMSLTYSFTGRRKPK